MLKKISPEFKQIALLFLSWRLALFIVAYFGYFVLPESGYTKFFTDVHPLFSMWLPYDSGWFTDIAKHGYSFNLHSMAFFPLWPLLIWLFSKIMFFAELKIVAFILANLITFLDCWVFYKLVKLDHDKETAFRSVKYLLFFPMSLFLATAYSEPIYLLTVLSAFYFIRTNKFAWGGISGAFASATRLVGTTLALPLLIEGLKQDNLKKNWPKIFWLLLAPLGFIGYILYSKYYIGDALGFLHAYVNSDWTRGTGFDAFFLMQKDFQTIFSGSVFTNNYPGALITTGSVVLFFIVLMLNIKKIRLSYLIYGLLLIIIPLFSGSLISLNRYVLPIFPFFIILGIYGKHKWFDEFITMLFLVLLGLFTVMFVNGWWVG